MQCACAILSPVACPALQYFSTVSPKRNDFRKKCVQYKTRIFIFSPVLVWRIFHSKNSWATYCQNLTLVSVYSTIYSCPIIMNLEFSGQLFEKYTNIKFHENPSSGSPFVPCGRTDGHDVASSCFSQFFRTRLINLHYICRFSSYLTENTTSVASANRWMRCRIVMADYCLNHTEQVHITFCGQKRHFLGVKLGAT